MHAVHSAEIRKEAESYFAAGQGYKTAAKVLGLSENTLHNWSRLYRKGKLGAVTFRRSQQYSPQDREKVEGLRREGKSWWEIAAATDAMSTCRKWDEQDQTAHQETD